MSNQLFSVGDLVRIRPFEEIDASDIGRERLTSTHCYSIDHSFIDSASADYGWLTVCYVDRRDDSWVYKMKDPTGDSLPFFWMQGMLYPAEEEELGVPFTDDEFESFARGADA